MYAFIYRRSNYHAIDKLISCEKTNQMIRNEHRKWKRNQKCTQNAISDTRYEAEFCIFQCG